jgi:hypothetical protein
MAMIDAALLSAITFAALPVIWLKPVDSRRKEASNHHH